MIETFESKLGQSVKMTELYDYLEMTPTYYSRWIEKEVLRNPYLEKDKDFIEFFIKRNAGRFRKEYYISITAAKKICLSMLKTSKNAIDLYSKFNKIDNEVVIIPVKTRKELLFEINLMDILDGITKIIPQYSILNYRIDFYLPELNIAIEYDENHHLSQKEYDKKRQKEIHEILKCDFIRVPEYCEQKAINQIIKLILHKSIKEFEFNDILSEFGNSLIDTFNIKTHNEIENEKFIEMLNNKL